MSGLVGRQPPAIRDSIKKLSRAVWRCGLAYGLLLLVLWLSLHYASDYYWWATALLFSPRWVFAMPLLPLSALLFLRLKGIILFAVLLIGVLGLLNVCVPWGRWTSARPASHPLRVLTCNCDSSLSAIRALAHLAVAEQLDVLALQDVPKTRLPQFFPESQWHLHVDSTLTLVSRFPIRRVDTLVDSNFPRHGGDVRHYEVEFHGGVIHFVNLHLATPRWGLEAVLNKLWGGSQQLQAASKLRRRQAEIAQDWIGGFENPIVMGDFNTPPESPLQWKYWSEFTNAFSVAGWGLGHTFFTRRNAVRIDHILVSKSWKCQECRVGPDVGSAHRPVIAVLEPARPE